MNGRDQSIESALRTALRDAADQIEVRPTSLTTAAEPVAQRVARRAPVIAVLAAGLVVVLIIGGALLVSGGHDPSSVQTPTHPPVAAVGGCAGKAFVANNVDGTVSAITTATRVVSPPITVPSRPTAVAITPDGTHVYVANVIDGTVSVITTATGAVSAPITVGQAPVGVAITPDGKHVVRDQQRR